MRRVITAGEFLSTAKAMPWVIEHLCTEGGSMMLYGKQKVGKSTLTAQLAHSLITGEPWMGFRILRTGPVLYLQLDLNPAEMQDILNRAEESGYPMRSGLLLPEFFDNEFRIPFNIFDENDAAWLAATCDEHKPIAVIVDTINDGYTMDAYGDINHLIRKVYAHFRAAIGGAVLVFVNHARKPSKDFRGQEIDDPDGYLGGTGWPAVASSILEVRTRHKGDDKSATPVVLQVRAGRNMPHTRAHILNLERDERGFFKYSLDKKQMLQQWPDFISPAALTALAPKSKMDVFRAIAARTGEKEDAVRQEFYRMRKEGVPMPWAAELEGTGDDDSACDDVTKGASPIYKGVTVPMSQVASLRTAST